MTRCYRSRIWSRPLRPPADVYSHRPVAVPPVIAAVLLTSFALLACGGDDTTLPAPISLAAIEVITQTSGVEIDSGGYVVSLLTTPEIQSRAAGPNDTIVFPDLAPDSYLIELSSVAANCEHPGPRIRTVEATSGDTARTIFEITCFSSDPLTDRIAFSSDRDSGDRDIYVMESDGSEVFNLSRDRTGEDITPAVSPDGSHVAYSSNRDGNFEIYLMLSSGTSKARQTASTATDRAPVWAPDGTAIAWVSNSTGEFRLAIQNLIPFPPDRPRTFLPLQPQSGLDWHPDGTKIAFASSVSGEDMFVEDIFVVDTSGVVINLTDGPGVDRDPAWSPDGSRIAFSSDRAGDFEIFVMNADGTGVTRLTNDPGSDLSPSWSPDGHRLAFESDRNGDFEIYLMNSDGSGLANLTQHPANDRDPRWTHQ